MRKPHCLPAWIVASLSYNRPVSKLEAGQIYQSGIFSHAKIYYDNIEPSSLHWGKRRRQAGAGSGQSPQHRTAALPKGVVMFLLRLLGFASWLKNAALSALRLAGRYPWQAALIIALVAAGWQWRGKQHALAARDAARSEIASMIDATKALSLIHI
jgi:hypothetical protein